MSATPDDPDPNPTNTVADGYPIEYEGDQYHPVPEWWVAHQGAVEGPEQFGPKLFATSYAICPERTMRIRHIHSVKPRCLVVDLPYVDTELGIHPLELTTATRWNHTVYPGHRPVDDVARPAEWKHLRELWSDREEQVPEDRETIDERYGVQR